MARFKVGDKVGFTYQGEKMEDVVREIRDGRVWVRSHGGYGRPLGYKAKDLTKKKNPTGQLLFRTRNAAVKYAREHGAKKYSVRKLKRGR